MFVILMCGLIQLFTFSNPSHASEGSKHAVNMKTAKITLKNNSVGTIEFQNINGGYSAAILSGIDGDVSGETYIAVFSDYPCSILEGTWDNGTWLCEAQEEDVKLLHCLVSGETWVGGIRSPLCQLPGNGGLRGLAIATTGISIHAKFKVKNDGLFEGEGSISIDFTNPKLLDINGDIRTVIKKAQSPFDNDF